MKEATLSILQPHPCEVRGSYVHRDILIISQAAFLAHAWVLERAPGMYYWLQSLPLWPPSMLWQLPS